MTVFERIKAVRRARNLSQEEVASWFSVSKQSYGRKERGIEGGFGPGEIALFLERTQVDARYLFGQIDSFEEADLRNKESASKIDQLLSQAAMVQAKLEKVERRVEPPKGASRLAERIAANAELQALLDLVQFWDGMMLRRFTDVAYGYVSGKRDGRAENQQDKDVQNGEVESDEGSERHHGGSGGDTSTTTGGSRPP